MEVLGLTQRLVERLTPQPPAPAQAVPPQQYQAQAQPLDPEGYVTGAQFQQAYRDFVAPDVQNAQDLAASAVYSFAQMKHPKEFSKYGPEIAQRLAGVPKRAWTLDNVETVVKLVKADHFADYQAEWETENRAKVEATIRSNGAGGPLPVSQENKENSLESEKIPDEWKRRAAKAGVTEATVREFCATNNQTPEQFYKLFETPRNPIVAEVHDGR